MDNETIIETTQGVTKIVRLNRPKKKNAINREMYLRLIKILNDAAIDDNISIVVLTGTNNVYSSGNDFGGGIWGQNDLDVVRDFINAAIMFPKILIAVVNGLAIGIAATSIPLFDLVFASENSYFSTPFTSLGIYAEGCSTITFPRVLGDRKAAEMLMFNYKLSAKEALDCKFINYIYKPEEIQSQVWDKIEEVSKMNLGAIIGTKKLMRDPIRAELLRANFVEIADLDALWLKRFRSKM